MPKINAEHDCKREKCKGDKFKQIKIECNRCEKDWMLDCLIEEDEIYELVKAIGLITLKQDETRGEVIVTKVTDEKKAIFKLIIGKESPIEYVCLTCKKKGGSTKVKLKQLDEAYEDVKTQLMTEKDTNNELKQKISDQNNKINDNEQLISQLTQNLEEKDRIIKRYTDNEMITLSDDDEENEESSDKFDMKKVKQMIQKTITKQFMKEMETMKQIVNDRNDEVMSLTARQRNVKFDERILVREMSGDESDQRERVNENNVQFSENLIPEQITKQTTHRENKLYSIYVSQFKCGINPNVIEEHIMRNTDIINPDAFAIEVVESARKDKNYIAFKISTLKYEIYNKIKHIWSPHYTARDFIPTTSENFTAHGNTDSYRQDRYKQRNRETLNRNYSTPREYNNMRTNDTRYTNENRWTENQNQAPNTPRRNTTNERYEQSKAQTYNKFNRNSTPNRYRGGNERGSQHTGRYEQAQGNQRYTQNNNNPFRPNSNTNFLERENETQQIQTTRNNYQQNRNR